MLLMRPHPRLRLTPGARLTRIAATLATALATTTLALTALGCSSSAGPGGGAGGATTEATSAGALSATGFDGALLPGNLRPREFTLTDQYGRRVSLHDFRGRVTILTFLYTASRTTAPLIAQQVRGALDELPRDVPALAVSVDPAGDTPARIRAFLRRNSLTGRLRYLTGTPAQLRAAWRAYAVVPASAGAAAYERGAFVVLLDRAGAERVDFPLEELTPEALAHDVRRLQSK
ncbi:MAG: SCO family protein [Solirubrobacteraceae bacterium]